VSLDFSLIRHLKRARGVGLTSGDVNLERMAGKRRIPVCM
jgi:hypothetical protein